MSINLTPAQLAAIEELHNEMINPSRGGVASLVGGGGVGKTTTIFTLINKLEREEFMKVLVCAPTHKACNVLRQTQVLFDNDSEVSTLASALGFKVLPEDGKRTFRASGPSKLTKFDVIVVDEASQVGSAAFRELVKQALEHEVIIVGLGDDCQTPPTKEFASPMFENGRLTELTEVIRYTGDVLVLATDMRKHIKSGAKTVYPFIQSLPKASSDIIVCDGSADFLKRMIELVKPDDPDFAKILAWRNVAVQSYNRTIHEAIHGKDAPEYVIGDIIMPQAPVMQGKTTFANTDDACRILSYETGVEDLLDMGKVLIPTNIFEVINIRTSDIFTFESVQAAHLGLYKQAMDEIVNMCRAGSQRWSTFYEIDERLVDVRHPYASTVHKCQGSTYQHNFMDIGDILRCRQSYVTNRLLYTGVTRANKLYLL